MSIHCDILELFLHLLRYFFFHEGDYEGVRCKVYFKGLPYQKEDDERTFLGVEAVKMDFSVKDITMGVENDNNNRVIRKFE